MVSLKHTYVVTGFQLSNIDRLKAAASNLVPTPVPADLLISVGPAFQITVSFTVDHPDLDTAAIAALATMKGQPIP